MAFIYFEWLFSKFASIVIRQCFVQSTFILFIHLESISMNLTVQLLSNGLFNKCSQNMQHFIKKTKKKF